MRLSTMWSSLVVPDDLGYFRCRDRYLVENPGLGAWTVLTEDEFGLLRALADGADPPAGYAGPDGRDPLERVLATLVLNWLVYLPDQAPGVGPAEPALGTVHYAVADGCHPRCPYCLGSCARSLPGELEPAESLDLVDQIAGLGAELLVLTGAEPMLRPDLFDVADRARARGLRVNLVTTGSRIRDAETARRVADTFAAVTVSLDGGAQQVPGADPGEDTVAQTVRGLALLNAAGVKPAIDHVVSPENIAALDNLMAFLDGIEFSRVRMMSHTAVGHSATGRGGWDGVPLGWEPHPAVRRSAWTGPVARTVLGQAPKAVRPCGVRADCGLGGIEIYVDPRGDVHARESVTGAPQRVGNLREQPLRQMFAASADAGPEPDEVFEGGVEGAGAADCRHCYVHRLRRRGPAGTGIRDDRVPAGPGRLGVPGRRLAQPASVRSTPVADPADHRTGRCRVTVGINPEIVWVDDSDEVRIYHPDDGRFQTLNASAAEIWRRIAAGSDVETVARELADEFGGDDEAEREVVARDVREFVALLRARDLLRAAEPADGEADR
ncbi:PqqD family peptide modification chaperone [Plantactinospora endophytica]|uniref:Radical SAM core domain-containing protein n=1 Tax=Plantactinospora endophytica TaxID=673535 RepID=A0ABQ4DSD8_9ACTN|nr:PqqD family peptide modification chaperone [Plantactinospora endophytica]GIG85364.1 hypothetical protein Pen02_03000 [Plantactinospora endophytica]